MGEIGRTIFLIMDNAGGYGTDDVIQRYTTNVKDTYNIEIIHQVPRSPFTKILDLGVCASLQDVVEKHTFHAKV